MEDAIIEAEKLNETVTVVELPKISEIKDAKLKKLGAKILRSIEATQRKAETTGAISDAVISAKKINWQKLDDTNHALSKLLERRDALMEVLEMICIADK